MAALQVFATYAEASAALPGLADGTYVEVMADENYADARTRYRVESGALVFKANLDQLRLDLANPDDGAKAIAISGTESYSPGTIGASIKISVKAHPWLATGDGVADDTAAIAAAIAFLKSRGGGELYFPAGRYNGYALIEDADNIVLSGDGASSVIYRPAMNSAGASVISIKAKTRAIANITIRDLYVLGSSMATGADAMGIECNRDMTECPYITAGVTVENCIVDTARTAGLCLRGVVNAKVLNNHVKNTGRDGIQVMGIALIEGNSTENTGDDGIGCHGIYNPGTNTYTPSYRVIANNVGAVRNGARGIAFAGSRDIVCTGNTIRGWGAFGIYVLHAAAFPEEAYPVSRVVIADNIIGCSSYSSASSGIGLQNSTDQSAFPDNNFVDYPLRSIMGKTGNYPMSHIEIRGNIVIADEYQGKTLGGFTYYNPRSGIRFIANGSFQNIAIKDNNFFGLSQRGIWIELSTANEYGIRKLRVRSNDFSACAFGIHFQGGAPSGGLWINDIIAEDNTFDGANGLGYTSPVGITANGIRKLALHRNSFANLTTSLSTSSTSVASLDNRFENAPGFGFNRWIYDPATNAWAWIYQTQGSWSAPFMLGNNYIWADSEARLRIKGGATAPTSDADGTIVGTQT